MKKANYDDNPRDYALQLIEEDRVSADALLDSCLASMSHDHIKRMLDNHELSPRFFADEEEED